MRPYEIIDERARGLNTIRVNGVLYDLREPSAPTHFKPYRRKQIAELRPYVEGEDLEHANWFGPDEGSPGDIVVSVSAEDRAAGSPKTGDMIARNPQNSRDQWLVSAAYFAENFEPMG